MNYKLIAVLIIIGFVAWKLSEWYSVPRNKKQVDAIINAFSKKKQEILARKTNNDTKPKPIPDVKV